MKSGMKYVLQLSNSYSYRLRWNSLRFSVNRFEGFRTWRKKNQNLLTNTDTNIDSLYLFHIIYFQWQVYMYVVIIWMNIFN